jgi:hypothetical protein
MLDISLIVERLAESGGFVGCFYEGGEWVVSVRWGCEADDSPMVGAEALGLGGTAQEALGAVMEQARLV